MVIYTGSEGSGKTTWMKLLRTMFGSSRDGGSFFSSAKPEDEILGSYNGLAESLSMLEFAETDKSNLKDLWGRVNAWISEEHTTIVKKNINAYEIVKYTRCVGTTNNNVPVPEGRRYAVMESSDELRYCVNRQTRKTDDDTTGKHKCGCACDRCVHLQKYHNDMNNDIMVTPDTAYIWAAFLAEYELPADCAITKHDIPSNNALIRVARASTTQAERFMRYLANQIPADGHEPWFPVANANEYIPGGAVLGTTRYTLETLWNEFNGIWTKGKHDDDRLNKTPGWRERFEPQVNHIKSCDDFEQKLGKLKAGLAHKAPGALVKGRHTFCGHTKRVWVLDHQLLHKHFETHEEDDDTEAPARTVFPNGWEDLEDKARTFVEGFLLRHQD